MNIFMCQLEDAKNYHAGSKGRQDIITTAMEMEFHLVVIKDSVKNLLVRNSQLFIGCLKLIFLINKNNYLLIHFPLGTRLSRLFSLYIKFILSLKKAYSICIIQDIQSLRVNVTQDLQKKIKEEISILNNFDFLIIHSKNMESFIRENGCIKKSIIIGPFDYYYNGKEMEHVYSKNIRIAFAGYLSKEKCGFLYKMPLINSSLLLYGQNFEGTDNPNIIYKGAFEPDKLIEKLEGEFGLVWDGDSADTCQGVLGNYEKYNSPHKFSLYIAAGMPVIVWSGAAIADYVSEKGIGLAVDSLYDVPEKLEKLTEEEYNLMLKKVDVLKTEFRTGNQLKTAIRKAMEFKENNK